MSTVKFDPNLSIGNAHSTQSLGMTKTFADTSTEIKHVTILDNVFFVNVIAAATSQDAIVKEIRDFVVAGDED